MRDQNATSRGTLDPQRQSPRRSAASAVFVRLALAVVPAAALAATGPVAPTWLITDLGTLDGHERSTSVASDVNDRGQVIGISYTPAGEGRAFMWTMADGMVDLGTRVGDPSFVASAISNAGHLVGARAGSGAAVLWTPEGGLVDLGTLPAPYDARSEAFAISDAGHVVGASYSATNKRRPFLWTAKAGMVALATIPGDAQAIAVDVNDAGTVVGQTLQEVSIAARALIWTAPNEVFDLGTLGGSFARAEAINKNGHVVGSSGTADQQTHAFLWTAKKGMRDLGVLPGAVDSFAVHINDAGVVVGTADPNFPARAEYRAFRWTELEGMVDLGTLGGFPHASRASGVNKAGWIVGSSYAAVGIRRATLWRPCGPTVTDAAADPRVLWPPNHQFVTVRLQYAVSVVCSTSSPSVTVSVTSNEPDGRKFVGDAIVVDTHTVLLRAERSGRGDGRVYTIQIRAVDAEGREAMADVLVTVPKSTDRKAAR